MTWIMNLENIKGKKWFVRMFFRQDMYAWFLDSLEVKDITFSVYISMCLCNTSAGAASYLFL